MLSSFTLFESCRKWFVHLLFSLAKIQSLINLSYLLRRASGILRSCCHPRCFPSSPPRSSQDHRPSVVGRSSAAPQDATTSDLGIYRRHAGESRREVYLHLLPSSRLQPDRQLTIDFPFLSSQKQELSAILHPLLHHASNDPSLDGEPFKLNFFFLCSADLSLPVFLGRVSPARSPHPSPVLPDPKTLLRLQFPRSFNPTPSYTSSTTFLAAQRSSLCSSLPRDSSLVGLGRRAD